MDSIIIPWKDVISKDVNDPSVIRVYDVTISANKKSVSHMVNVFNRNKAAADWKRGGVSKRGSIDPSKLHSYRFNDDIFSRKMVKDDSKNHGLIMMVDWSGSMGDVIESCMKEVIMMTEFCRRVNVPFRVFAFSNTVQGGSYRNPAKGVVNNAASVSGLNLIEFLNSDMKSSDYKKACIVSLNAAKGNDGRFDLGGTPLTESMYCVPQLVNEMKASKGVSVVDVVYITDGGSTYLPVEKCHSYTGSRSDRYEIVDSRIGVTELISNNKHGYYLPPKLLQVLSKSYGFNTLNYHVIESHDIQSISSIFDVSDASVDVEYGLNTNGVYGCSTNSGFDNVSLVVQDFEATGRADEINKRKMLTRFVEVICGKI